MNITNKVIDSLTNDNEKKVLRNNTCIQAYSSQYGGYYWEDYSSSKYRRCWDEFEDMVNDISKYLKAQIGTG